MQLIIGDRKQVSGYLVEGWGKEYKGAGRVCSLSWFGDGFTSVYLGQNDQTVHLNMCSLWYISYNSTKLLKKQLGQTKSALYSDPPLPSDGKPGSSTGPVGLIPSSFSRPVCPPLCLDHSAPDAACVLFTQLFKDIRHLLPRYLCGKLLPLSLC